MKRIAGAGVVVLAVLVLGGGCDKLRKVAAPQPKTKQTVAGVPALEILGVTEEEQVALRKYLVVKGLLQQAEDYVVIINTQLVRKGESMRMKIRKDEYDIRVLSISEMRVVLEAARATPALPSAP